MFLELALDTVNAPALQGGLEDVAEVGALQHRTELAIARVGWARLRLRPFREDGGLDLGLQRTSPRRPRLELPGLLVRTLLDVEQGREPLAVFRLLELEFLVSRHLHVLR